MSELNQLDKIVPYHEDFLQKNTEKINCVVIIGFIGTGKSTLC